MLALVSRALAATRSAAWNASGVGNYLMTAGVRSTTATVDRAFYRTDRHTLTNLVVTTRTSMDDHDEKKNVRSSKSEAKVTNNRRLRST